MSHRCPGSPLPLALLVLVALACRPEERLCSELLELEAGADATPTLERCVAETPVGGVLSLPPGRYVLGRQLVLARRITVQSAGSWPGAPACAADDPGCARLVAADDFSDRHGVLRVLELEALRRVVVDGSRATRPGAAQRCQGQDTPAGYNLVWECDDCRMLGSVSAHAVCGTGLEVRGRRANVSFVDNLFLENGDHTRSMLWADGLTLHDAEGAIVALNRFVDNTDVDLILGGCRNCLVWGNQIRHTSATTGGSFAALMLHKWPLTGGDYSGSIVTQNDIDCGPRRACGFGLLVGSDAWYDQDVSGGVAVANRVSRAQIGLAVDDAEGSHFEDNVVLDTASGTIRTSCGGRQAAPVTVSPRSSVTGIAGARWDWDGCIPNWPF